MRVFLTGGSGFIGSAIVQDLHNAGHQITGLARSEESATKLEAAGVTVLRGSLDDLDSLTRGARESEGVIHVGYNHDWLRNPTDDVMKAFMAAAETDRRAIETLAAALEGSNRPLVIATGTAGMTPGKLGTEEEDGDPAAAGAGRRASEQAALSMAARGVRSSIVRLPPTVHGAGDHGFVYRFVEIARAKNASAYIGDGSNRWPAVHRVDAAQAFRLALEEGARRIPRPCGSRRRRPVPTDRAGNRRGPRCSSRLDRSGPSRRTVRSARKLRRPRQPDVEPSHPRAARLESDARGAGRRYRSELRYRGVE